MRPTLESQLAYKKKQDKAIEDFFTLRHDLLGQIDFWLHRHKYSHIIFSILHWNWFCIWCGKTHFRWTETKCREEFWTQKEKK